MALTTVPFVTLAGLIWFLALAFEDWSWTLRYESHPKRTLAMRFCALFVAWVLGTPFFCLMAEICCCSGVALALFFLFSERFNDYQAAGIFWGKVFSFLNDGCNWKDKLLRTVLVLENVLKTMGTENELSRFLAANRQTTYSNVTWSDLRFHSSNCKQATPCKMLAAAHSSVWKEHIEDTKWLLNCDEVSRRRHQSEHFLTDACVDFCSWPILLFSAYVAFPTYVLCRFVNFLFVWLLLATSDFAEVEHLQLAMAALLAVLQLTWFIALAMVLRLHFATWHLLAGHRSVWITVNTAEDALERWQRIVALHNAHTVEPFRKQAVLDHFGPDVGSIVLLYLPSILHDIGSKQ